ncbi:hypothetical protein JTE90_012813 [Oedothorax gibbosus]|uniref:Cuticle protein n=1 Tax=Oedothorax gibbosus TaxID=931172 RepID=A0AAV6VYP5_9ARAC|nr:hypothetical protein JTE90_012813 [Oedothorax gibbosus]
MFEVLLFASLALMCQCHPHFNHYSSAPAVNSYIQPLQVKYVTAPVVQKAKPYKFGYNAPAIGGGSSRLESSDGHGRVTGQYTVSDADGRLRVVDYYADHTGFHADVKTNEPGTANQNPANVNVKSFAAPPVQKVVVAPPVKYVAPPVKYVAPPFKYVAPPVKYVAPPVKYVTQPIRYVAPVEKYVSQAPVYSVAAPVRQFVSSYPAKYGVLPEYNSFYTPVTYKSYSPHYGHYDSNLDYWK